MTFKKFIALADVIDRITRAFCMAAGLVLMATMLVVVVLRYGFATSFIEQQHLANYALAIFVILCVPVCMARRGHVLVEVLSEPLSPAYRRGADAAALVVVLVPIFGLILRACWADIVYSWSIRARRLWRPAACSASSSSRRRCRSRRR